MKFQEWRDHSGLYHREDGPAIIENDGSKFYYIHGLLHRDNGPAIVFANGKKEFWLNGIKLTNVKSTVELILQQIYLN